MSKFIQKRRSILKSTLETLKLASFSEVKLDLVNLIMRNMDCQEVVRLGYEFKSGEVSEDLQEDFKYIQNNSGADYLPIHEKIIKKIEEYKNSDSFQKILRDIKAEKFSEGRLGNFGNVGADDLTKMMDPYKN